MPVHINIDSDETTSLEEYLEYVRTEVDITDDESIKASAPMLKALSNNRTFLAQQVNQELKDIANLQDDNRYSAQVIMLGLGDNWFVRANFWPSNNESVVRSSGADPFFYFKPHDHNFSFLTVGYYGPGYWSDYYTYDHSKVIGYNGEHVDLHFVERARLEEGKIMLYRGSYDIHNQLLPDSLSISINLMQNLQEHQVRTNQYFIDIKNSCVRTLANRTSPPLMLSVAAHIGNDSTDELLDHLLHPSYCPRTRVAAYKALAHRHPKNAEQLWRQAAIQNQRYVAAHGKQFLNQLEQA